MKKLFFNLKQYENKIDLGFFTSVGGVSKNNFSSLNCSLNSGDDTRKVKKNISIALKKLDLVDKKLKLIKQIHSNKIHIINKKNYKKKLIGDGLITKEKNLVLGVLTADCAPIFLFDIKNKVICCLHSGWKGTLLNITKRCIEKLKVRDNHINNLVAIVGPCIGLSSYEVDKSFKYKFIKKNYNYSKFFKEKNKNKDLFNLRGIINYQLKSEGIKNIHNIRRDTYKDDNFFFSHRKSKNVNKISTGRMINIISLKD